MTDGLGLSRRSVAIRLATFYAVMCTYNAVGVPFWPVWLADRGMDPHEIALLFGITYLARVLVNPLFGAMADRYGDLRGALLVLVASAACANALFALANDFWTLAAVTFLSASLMPTIFPIMEGVTLRGALAYGLDYARVRVGGSISFMLGTIAFGALIDQSGIGIVLPALLAILGTAFLAGLGLPKTFTRHDAGHTTSNKPSPWRLLRQPSYVLLASAAGLIQASHGVYYAFGSLNWARQDFSPTLIGALWAIGVLAEIALFLGAKTWLRNVSPLSLLYFGGGAALVRWTWMSFAPSLAVTLPLQVFHALTYGATHLATMAFMAQAIPRTLSASAQTLFSSVFSAAAFGVVTLVAGPVFAAYGAGVYGLSALIAALGLLVVWRLDKTWDRQALKL